MRSGIVLTVARAEQWRQSRRPLLPIGAAILSLLAYQPLAYTGPGSKGLVAIGEVVHDAPIVVGTLFGRLMLAASFFVALIFADAGHRDAETGWRPMLLSTPASTGAIIAGRYAASLAVSLLMLTAPLLVAWVALAGLPAEVRGVHGPIASLLVPFIWMVVPGVVGLGAIFLGLGAVGGMPPVLVTLLALVAVHPALASAGTAEGAFSALAASLDPFGVAAISHATRYWSLLERSTNSFPVTWELVMGRVGWLGAGAVALVVAAARLRRTVDASATRRAAGPGRRRIRAFALKRRRATPAASAWHALVWHEWQRAVLHPATFAICVLACVQVYRNLAAATVADGTGSAAVSAVLLGAMTNVDEFVLGLTVLFAALLGWRERIDGSWNAVEATPVPSMMLVGAKFVAICAAQAAVLCSAIALTIVFQLTRGEQPDPGAFALVAGLVEMPRYACWALLALASQAIAPNGTLGFAFAGGAMLLVDAVLPALGVTSPLLLYGAVPPHQYSAMTGLAPFTETIIALRLYWLAASVPLFLATARVWRRGAGESLAERWRRGRLDRRARGLGFASAAAAATFATVMSVREATDGETPFGAAEFRAEYEARYAARRHAPTATLAGVDLVVDFFPRDRRVVVMGTYDLVNRSGRPIDRLDVFHFPILHARLVRLEVDRASGTVVTDDEVGLRTLPLADPLSPGDSLRVRFEVDVDAPRVSIAHGNPDLTTSGSYIDNFVPGRYFPSVGYDATLELMDDALRRANGLGPSALPAPGSVDAGSESMVPPTIRFRAEVRTSRDQVVVAPGTRVAEREEGDRRVAVFEAADMRGSFAFVSGRYERDERREGDTTIEFYHHPGHGANIDRMAEGAFAALAIGRRYAPYPYDVLRIVEVPDRGHIGGTARAMPMMVAWNETGGWLDDYRDAEAFPFAFATAAHEVAHQWWPGRVSPAFAQGFGAIAEGLPDVVRVRAIEDRLGEHQLTYWMRRQSTQYFRARGLAREQPLLQAAQAFVYREKSQFAFRWLAWAAGAGAVDESIGEFTRAFGATGSRAAASTDLRAALRRHMPDSLAPALERWFDRVVHWDLAAIGARTAPSPAGYDVDVRVMFTRFETNRDGQLREVQGWEEVEIFAYDAGGAVVGATRARLQPGEQSIRIATTSLPSRVLLDPRELLLDARQSDDGLLVAPPGQ